MPGLEQLRVLLHARNGLLVAQSLLLGESGRVVVVIVDLEDVGGEVLLPAGVLLAALVWLNKPHFRQELLLCTLLHFVWRFGGCLLLVLRRLHLPVGISSEAVKLCLLHVAYEEGLLLLQVQPWLDQLLVGLQFHVLVLVPVGHLTGRRHPRALSIRSLLVRLAWLVGRTSRQFDDQRLLQAIARHLLLLVDALVVEANTA